MTVHKVLFERIESKRTFEEVSSRIRKSILDGTLKNGTRLPSEGDLAKQFNVGRQTVREALRILELSGFITIQKGSGGGPIIKDNVLGRTTDLLSDALQMEKISVDEFTDARLLIEKAVMNDAIDHAKDQDIRNLQENLLKAKDLIAQKKVATDVNFEFHSLLAEASKNTVFAILERAINSIQRDLRTRSSPDLRTSKAAVQAHEKILDALVRKKRNRAIDLLEKHIIAIQKSLSDKIA